MLSFAAQGVAVDVDLEHGGRLASLRLHGRELLVTSAPREIDWGWYPMAPWAGRTRCGIFEFGGVKHRLPLHADGHALHGTVLNRPWGADHPESWSTDLGPDWPFDGRVRQSIDLSPGELLLTMELTSEGPAFPAVIGWHPWFRRRLEGSEATVDLPASFMLKRDRQGIATRRRVAVPPGPWDDCFGGLAGPVGIEWPGVVKVRVESDCPYVVVFTEHPDGVCVEPQTGPPNALNLPDTVVTPGRPLQAWMRLTWDT